MVHGAILICPPQQRRYTTTKEDELMWRTFDGGVLSVSIGAAGPVLPTLSSRAVCPLLRGCHGPAGKGDGIAGRSCVPSLDLTQIAAKNNGDFRSSAWSRSSTGGIRSRAWRSDAGLGDISDQANWDHATGRDAGQDHADTEYLRSIQKQTRQRPPEGRT
jgi:hypothetical protein